MVIELVFNILIGLAFVFYLAQALQLPTTDNPVDVLGAGGYPLIIGTLGLIVLATVTVRVLRRQHGAIDIPLLKPNTVNGRVLIVNVLLLGAYAGLLDVAGFILSTLVYLFACPLSIGFRKIWALAAFSIATTAILVVTFGMLFYVPLPRGISWLREFSYLIY